MLRKIISGGQTGADRGALIAAKRSGFPTGGWMPMGFKAEDGNHPEYSDLYNLQEHSSPKYPPRTAKNIYESDGTIIISSGAASPGVRLTISILDRCNKPYILIHPLDDRMTPRKALVWVTNNNIEVLNVAGHRESVSEGIQEFTENFIGEMLANIKPV